MRKHLGHSDEARALAKDIWTHTADILPDPVANTLTIRLHHFTNPQASRAVQELLTQLNSTETHYPGTTLQLRYELVSTPIPGDRDPCIYLAPNNPSIMTGDDRSGLLRAQVLHLLHELHVVIPTGFASALR